MALRPVPGKPGEFVDDETSQTVKIADWRDATVEERDAQLRWNESERLRRQKLPN